MSVPKAIPCFVAVNLIVSPEMLNNILISYDELLKCLEILIT